MKKSCPECHSTVTEDIRFCPFCGFPVMENRDDLQREFDHIDYLIQQTRTWVDQGIVFPIVVDTIEEIYRSRQENIHTILVHLPKNNQAESNEVLALEDAVVPAVKIPADKPEISTTEASISDSSSNEPMVPAGSGLLSEVRKLGLQIWKAGPEELIRWGVWLSAGIIVIALVLLLGETLLMDSQLKILGAVALSFLLALSGWGLVKRNVTAVGSFLLILGNAGFITIAAGAILSLEWDPWQTGLFLGILGMLLFLSTAMIVRMSIFSALGAIAFSLCGTGPFLLENALSGWWPGVMAAYFLVLVILFLIADHFKLSEETVVAPLGKIGRCGAWVVLLSLLQQPFGERFILIVSWVAVGALFLLLGRGRPDSPDTLLGFVSCGISFSWLLLYLVPWFPYTYISVFLSGLLLAVLGAIGDPLFKGRMRDVLLRGGTLLLAASLFWGVMTFAVKGREALISLGFILLVSSLYCLLIRNVAQTGLANRETTGLAWLLFSLAVICFIEDFSFMGGYTRAALYTLFGFGVFVFTIRKPGHPPPGAALVHVIWMMFALYISIGSQASWLVPLIGSAGVMCFLYLAAFSNSPWLVFATLMPVLMSGYGLIYTMSLPQTVLSLALVISGWFYQGGALLARRLKSTLVHPLRLTSGVAVWISWIALIWHLLSNTQWSVSFHSGIVLPSLSLLFSAGFWVFWGLTGGYPRCFYLAAAALAGILCFLLTYLGVTHWMLYTLPWSLLIFGISVNDTRWAPGGWVVTYLVPADWKIRIACFLILSPVFLQALTLHDPFLGAVWVLLVASIFLLAGLLIRSRVLLFSGLFFMSLECLVILVLIIPFHELGLGEILFFFGILGLTTALLFKRSNRTLLSRFYTRYQQRLNRLIGEPH